MSKIVRRPWTNEEDEFLMENYKTMNDSMLSKKLERSREAIRKRRSTLGFLRRDVRGGQYALYKGDTLLHIGTVNEIAEIEGVKPETIRFYKNPTYKRRRAKSKNYRELVLIDE